MTFCYCGLAFAVAVAYSTQVNIISLLFLQISSITPPYVLYSITPRLMIHGCWGCYTLADGPLLCFERRSSSRQSRKVSLVISTIDLSHDSVADSLSSSTRATPIGELQLLVAAQTLVADGTLTSSQPDAVLSGKLLAHLQRIARINQCTSIKVQRQLAAAATLQTEFQIDGGEAIFPLPPYVFRSGEVIVRPAVPADKKAWIHAVLSSCRHNMGGLEMVRETLEPEFRIVAERRATGEIVGLLCANADGWIPYVTSSIEGLGCFLLFLGIEWLRLIGRAAASLSPSSPAVAKWYQQWGFRFLREYGVTVPITDRVMQRTIARATPCFDGAIYEYIEGLPQVKGIRTGFECAACVALSVSPSKRSFADERKFRLHVESHLRREVGSVDYVLAEMTARECAWTICEECGVHFDAYGSGCCSSCWKQTEVCDETDRPKRKVRRVEGLS